MKKLETETMPQEKTVVVRIERYSNGFIATSTDMTGLYVSYKSLGGLLERIPVAIRLLMKALHGRDFEVSEKSGESERPRLITPEWTFEAKLAA